jgi:protein involved in polysaccharide export with SLBB domain
MSFFNGTRQDRKQPAALAPGQGLAKPARQALARRSGQHGRHWWLSLLALCAFYWALPACSLTPDKRVLQYLNQEGFGHRYPGNAEEENYVTVGDSFRWSDQVDKAKRNGIAKIEIDGYAFIEGIGAVHVAGMTRNQLESYLTQKFAAIYKQTDVKVDTLLTASPKIYYIFGEVPVEGPQIFKGNLTIADAVWTARPDRVRANLGRIKLIRPDPVDPLVMRLDLRPLLTFGDSTDNVIIQERDIIVVPPTMLARLGNLLSAIISPFTALFSEIIMSLFRVNQFQNFGNAGNNLVF